MGNGFPKMTYKEKWFIEINRICDRFHDTEYCNTTSDGKVLSLQGIYLTSSTLISKEKWSLINKRTQSKMGREKLLARAQATLAGARKNGAYEKVECPQCRVLVARCKIPNHIKTKGCSKRRTKMMLK
jgi:hypothetical protein